MLFQRINIGKSAFSGATSTLHFIRLIRESFEWEPFINQYLNQEKILFFRRGVSTQACLWTSEHFISFPKLTLQHAHNVRSHVRSSYFASTFISSYASGGGEYTLSISKHDKMCKYTILHTSSQSRDSVVAIYHQPRFFSRKYCSNPGIYMSLENIRLAVHLNWNED